MERLQFHTAFADQLEERGDEGFARPRFEEEGERVLVVGEQPVREAKRGAGLKDRTAAVSPFERKRDVIEALQKPTVGERVFAGAMFPKQSPQFPG